MRKELDLHMKRKRRSKTKPLQSGSLIDNYVVAHQGRIIIGLCMYAWLRILVLSAAFPLLNNIDEAAHFDSIVKFSRGDLPGEELPLFNANLADFLSRYNSFEYITPLRQLQSAHLDVPNSELPKQIQDALYRAGMEHWTHGINYEFQSPPLYYIVAASWYRLGMVLRLREWQLAYWTRFLNTFAFALLVWLSYRFVLLVYPQSAFLAVGVPALLAVFPLDVFFGMNRDVLSAPLTAAVFVLMMEALLRKTHQYWYLLSASFLVGLAPLINIPNCVLFAVLGATMVMWLHQLDETRARKIWATCTSAVAALVLPSLWMLRNYLVMGDFTGSRAKMQFFGWTRVPISKIFDHPMFSWEGFSYFLLNNVQTFWRGEAGWHRELMRLVTTDWFYVFSSFVLILIFLVHFIVRWRAASPVQRLAGFEAGLVVFGLLSFMAVLSVLFDFDGCFYPSSRHPFFVSGRIISGAMLPFALMYVSGLEVAVRPVRKWIHPAVVLGLVMLLITVSEILVTRPVFSSAFNFFALASGRR
jgi:hypothetical protein